MTELKSHTVYRESDRGHVTNELLAYIYPASSESVKTVMEANPDSPDGRSQYVWIRLQNGDLILGVYPQGDTYFAVEEDAQYSEKPENEGSHYTFCKPS